MQFGKMNRKRAVLFCGLLVAAGLLTACGQRGTSEMGEGDFLVGFANSSLNHPWRVAIQEAILAEAAKYPDIRVVTTEAKEQPAKQLSDVEDLLARGIDLLLVCTVEGEPFRPAVAEVKRAGIPLVPVDRNIIGDDYTVYVGQSNLEIGERVADYIAEELTKRKGEPSGKVIELQGTPGNVPTEHRREGFHRRIAEKYPDIEIVASQNTDYTRAGGMRVMENLLQAHPQIDAIYTHEDEIALGAIEALKAAGRMSEDIIITGNGGSGAALQSIRNGEMTACATYSPIDAGTIGMRAAAKILHGESAPKDIVLHGAIVTAENLEHFARPDMGNTDYVYTVDLQTTDLPEQAN